MQTAQTTQALAEVIAAGVLAGAAEAHRDHAEAGERREHVTGCGELLTRSEATALASAAVGDLDRLRDELTGVGPNVADVAGLLEDLELAGAAAGTTMSGAGERSAGGPVGRCHDPAGAPLFSVAGSPAVTLATRR